MGLGEGEEDLLEARVSCEEVLDEMLRLVCRDSLLLHLGRRERREMVTHRVLASEEPRGL